MFSTGNVQSTTAPMTWETVPDAGMGRKKERVGGSIGMRAIQEKGLRGSKWMRMEKRQQRKNAIKRSIWPFLDLILAMKQRWSTMGY
jgi:hypothetical protein